MISLGIGILILGLIIWAVGVIAHLAAAITVGKVVGVIGAVLLAVGLAIYLINALTHGDTVEVGAWQDLVIG